MRANEQACSFHGRDSQLSAPLPLSAGVATLYVYICTLHTLPPYSQNYSVSNLPLVSALTQKTLKPVMIIRTDCWIRYQCIYMLKVKVMHPAAQ